MKRKSLLALLILGLIFSLMPAGALAAYSYETPVIEVIKSVNFRTGPSTDDARIRYLQVGEVLDVISEPNSNWVQARDASGTVGYVSSSATYIKKSFKTVYPEPNGKIVASVSFRTGPSVDNARIRYLSAGESIWVLERVNDYWFKAADTNNVIGYVSTSSKYITTTFSSEPSQSIPSEEEVLTPIGEPNGQVVASVSFRTGPSIDDSRIRYLQAGELIWILEAAGDSWFKAADENNTVGYVSSSSKYIDTMFNAVSEAEEASYIEEPNATVLKSVSFRTGPSTDDSRIRYLQAGEPLWILDKPNSYWYKAKDKNGVIGFVSTSSSYLTTTYVEAWKTLDPSVAAEMAIEAGLKYLGTPYQFGSSRLDTSTFDCSDFVRQAYLDGIGIKLPGDSRQQGDFIKEQQAGQVVTDWRQLKRGDLMFFMEYAGYKASSYAGIDKSTETIRHVGIYLGNGQVLHTYSIASGGVKINDIAGTHWEYRFLYGGSVLK